MCAQTHVFTHISVCACLFIVGFIKKKSRIPVPEFLIDTHSAQSVNHSGSEGRLGLGPTDLAFMSTKAA